MRGKIELRKQLVDIVEIIQQAAETAAPLLAGRHHQLETRFPKNPVYVLADPVRLSQILTNLLTNAAKYTEPRGRIEIAVDRTAESVAVRITDNGIGIANNQLEGIFDLFMQVDHATTRAQGGLGIGLTLAKNLVELHSGTIKVDSQGLGHGCTFTVQIPLAPAELIPKSTPDPGSSHAPLVACKVSRQVLVVDDNRDAANSLALLLRTLGHAVEVAHSGQEAIQQVREHCPNIVFLDLGMPGMDGYEVASNCARMPAFKICAWPH